MKKLILAVCIGALCLSCVACNSGEAGTVTETTQDVYAFAEYNPEESLVLTEQNTSDALYGEWFFLNFSEVQSYTFNEDGTGVYTVNGVGRNFTYNVIDDGHFEMLLEEVGFVERYAYSISEDGILTLHDDFGGLIELSQDPNAVSVATETMVTE